MHKYDIAALVVLRGGGGGTPRTRRADCRKTS
jgi:hypothetical protein